MAAVANHAPQNLHRKPVAGYTPGNAYQQPAPQHQQPYNAAISGAQYAMNGMQPLQRNPSPGYNNNMPYQPPSQQQPQQQQYLNQSRRTLSNATSSTSSTNNANGMQRQSVASAYTVGVRRSTSSRSNASASPTSYVALMRKQKATVWCDRAQHQDPRILAAQRQAKMRAVMEVAGGQNHTSQARISNSSSGITGGVRSKIRHHGAPKAKDYNSGNLSGAGVPMRLSASEVDEVDSDDEARSYQRASSSRSSMGSANAYGFSSSYRGYGNGASPNAVSPVESMGDLAEEETPMPGQYANQGDYFGQTGGTGGSGSSGEAEKNFGGVSGLPQTTRAKTEDHVSSDELRRRGSVDDRTMTLSAGRLFVANPDLSD